MTDTDANAPPVVTAAAPVAADSPDAAAGPAGVGAERGDHPRRGWRSRWGPLLVTALVGAVVALVSAYLIWPHGSINLDEIVYINQGQALAHGHLTLDAGTYTPDFRPYLTGVARGRVVFKYQPLWPAVLAVSDVVTGDHRPALVAAGAAAALAFGFLGRELTGRRRLGAITGVGVALSPVFVVHSGTALAYLPSAALSAAAVAAALRAVRTGRWGWYAASGAGFGALFFHRPFDALVTGLPVAVWLLARAVRRRAPGPVVAAGLAAVPFLALWLAYNRLTTGSILSPAFGIGAPEDRFGFGRRASWTPTHPLFKRTVLDFTPTRSLHTVVHFAAITPLFTLGGVVVLGLAVYAAWVGRRDPRRLVLAAIPLLVIGGHFFWWGTLNFVNFGMDDTLGPAYWLGAVGPVAALATAGGHDLYRRLADLRPQHGRPLVAGGAALAALVVLSSVASAVNVGHRVADARRLRVQQIGVLDAAPAGSVLVVPGAVDNPYVHAVVPVDLAGARRLQAVDLPGAGEVFRLRDGAPGRAVWRWVPVRPSGALAAPPKRFALGEIGEVRAPQVTGRLVPVRADDTVTSAYLRTVDDNGDEIARVALDPAGPRGPVVGRADPPLVGARPVWLALGATLDRPGQPPEIVEVRWPARTRGGRVEVDGPGAGYRFYRLPAADVWSPEDASDAITATVDGLAPFQPVAVARKMP